MEIIFEADTKLLFAKYCQDIWLHLLEQVFPEGQKSIFSVHCPAHLDDVWSITVFGFYYKLSDFLAIIDRCYVWLSSDWTIWYNLTSLKHLLSNMC